MTENFIFKDAKKSDFYKHSAFRKRSNLKHNFFTRGTAGLCVKIMGKIF